MMKQVINLALVAIVSMTLMSCMSVSVGNNGRDNTPSQVKEINQVTAMQPFDEVDIAGAFKVIYEQNDEFSVRVEASPEAFKEMTVYVKDRELRIRKSVSKPTQSFQNVKIYVTSPDIEMIDLAGSGVFTSSKPIAASKDLNVDVAGSGEVLLVGVTCRESDLEIAGSGNIEIGNFTATKVNADIAGSGNINMGTLKCTDLDIDIAGSGDVNCDNIDADKVQADIAGSGNVNLKGNVRNVNKDIAGSGKVNISGLE